MRSTSPLIFRFQAKFKRISSPIKGSHTLIIGTFFNFLKIPAWRSDDKTDSGLMAIANIAFRFNEKFLHGKPPN